MGRDADGRGLAVDLCVLLLIAPLLVLLGIRGATHGI
jgi:hypothetical protein